MLFSKSILEYIRAHKRTGLQDFFEWCFDILMNLAGSPDRQISAMAFDVLEETCSDELSMNQLLKKNNDTWILEL